MTLEEENKLGKSGRLTQPGTDAPKDNEYMPVAVSEFEEPENDQN